MSEVVNHHNNQQEGIVLTNAAKRHILNYLAANNSKGFRLSVKKTGCSGLSYQIDYVDEPSSNDVVFPLETTYLICIDKSSYPFLKGLQIDYVKQGLNYRFEFSNPNQTGQCGCGESFTVS